MLRISKMADYAIVIMHTIANDESNLNSASDIATRASLPVAAVRKLLRMLNEYGLVESARGANGGYRLNQPANQVRLVDIINAVEGPTAITECCAPDNGCPQFNACGLHSNWQLVNDAIVGVLAQITLADMLRSLTQHPVVLHGIKG